MSQNKILAVVTGVETSVHVLDAAIEHAEREAGSLVVLHVMPRAVYEGRQRSAATTRELRYDGFTFTHEQAVESAKNVAERAAQAAIGDRDIPYTSVGWVGDFVGTVLESAAAYECETIFLAETAPWWRRVLGRADRRLARQFDGLVVRVPQPFPDNLKTTRPLREY